MTNFLGPIFPLKSRSFIDKYSFFRNQLSSTALEWMHYS